MQMLYEETKGEAIISTGVGQHQMWAAQWYKYNEPRRWVSSGGLGSMGFGLPSAIGAAVAHDGTDGRPKRVSQANTCAHMYVVAALWRCAQWHLCGYMCLGAVLFSFFSAAAAAAAALIAPCHAGRHRHRW